MQFLYIHSLLAVLWPPSQTSWKSLSLTQNLHYYSDTFGGFAGSNVPLRSCKEDLQLETSSNHSFHLSNFQCPQLPSGFPDPSGSSFCTNTMTREGEKCSHFSRCAEIMLSVGSVRGVVMFISRCFFEKHLGIVSQRLITMMCVCMYVC